MDLSYRNIWKITYPIFVSLLLQQIIGITDVVFLGRIGEIALSASALGSTYFLIIFMVAVGFSIGAQIIMARHNGEKKYEKIGPIFHQTTSILFIASIIIVLGSLWISPRFLSSIISSEEIYLATLDYINWRFWGFIPLFIVIVIRAFFIATTKTKILTWASSLMVGCNIFLNYCLIFGHYGLPRMETAGAALASSLSEGISLIFLAGYGILKVDLKKYGLTQFCCTNFKLLKDIWNLSVWTMLQQFLSVGCWFVFFLAIEHLGERSLAAASIIRSVSAFPFMVTNALAISASTLVSNLIGAKEKERVIFCCNRLICLALSLVLPLLIALAVGWEYVLRIYTDDTSLFEFIYPTFMIMLGSNLPITPGWILFNAISGTGKTRIALMFELFANVFYITYIVLITYGLHKTLAWCWGADYVYNVIILILAAYYMYGKKWDDNGNERNM